MEEVPLKYVCEICMKVLRDARLTACCSQHYCDSCLTKWNNRTCPHCRKEKFQSIINKEKVREIRKLHVHCTNREKSCEWVGELGNLLHHLQLDDGCCYEEVECPNLGYEQTYLSQCRKKFERRFIAHHKDHECSYRDYTCEYCGKEDTYDAIAGTGRISKTTPTFLEAVKGLLMGSAPTGNHYDICDHFPLKCPNECGESSIKRKEMETHLEVCPLQPLDCPYNDAGCTDKILREDMESHVKNGMEEQLMMVFQSFQV